MPLLAAEPNIHPTTLLETQTAELNQDGQWWVLHTRPRQEKALARQLLHQHIPFYLPLITRRLRLRGRTLSSHVPLFPGYLFLLGNREQRTAALASQRVVRTLPVAQQQHLWRDLRQVQQLIAAGAPITPEDRLMPGVVVEIQSGPLRGLTGKIARTASGRRFVVEVDFIQRGASVMLEDFHLTVVN
jgi:transcriptional antiterminator RfaH